MMKFFLLLTVPLSIKAMEVQSQYYIGQEKASLTEGCPPVNTQFEFDRTRLYEVEREDGTVDELKTYYDWEGYGQVIYTVCVFFLFYYTFHHIFETHLIKLN